MCCEAARMFWNLSASSWVLWFTGADRIRERWFLRIVALAAGYFLVSTGGVSVPVLGAGIRSLKHVDKRPEVRRQCFEFVMRAVRRASSVYGIPALHRSRVLRRRNGMELRDDATACLDRVALSGKLGVRVRRSV